MMSEETNSVIDTIWIESIASFWMSLPSLNHLIVMGESPETTEQMADALIPSSK